MPRTAHPRRLQRRGPSPLAILAILIALLVGLMVVAGLRVKEQPVQPVEEVVTLNAA